MSVRTLASLRWTCASRAPSRRPPPPAVRLPSAHGRCRGTRAPRGRRASAASTCRGRRRAADPSGSRPRPATVRDDAGKLRDEVGRSTADDRRCPDGLRELGRTHGRVVARVVVAAGADRAGAQPASLERPPRRCRAVGRVAEPQLDVGEADARRAGQRRVERQAAERVRMAGKAHASVRDGDPGGAAARPRPASRHSRCLPRPVRRVRTRIEPLKDRGQARSSRCVRARSGCARSSRQPSYCPMSRHGRMRPRCLTRAARDLEPLARDDEPVPLAAVRGARRARACRGGRTRARTRAGCSTIARRVRWLHAHWPESLYRWHRGPAPSAAAALVAEARDSSRSRLRLARALGYRFVWTIHQVYPHDSDDPALDRAGRESACRAPPTSCWPMTS